MDAHVVLVVVEKAAFPEGLLVPEIAPLFSGLHVCIDVGKSAHGWHVLLDQCHWICWFNPHGIVITWTRVNGIFIILV